MNKLSTILLISLLTIGCQKAPSQEIKKVEAPKENIKVSLEETFWSALQNQCSNIFQGQSSFPADPEDSFYGKTLIADFSTCTNKEIRVPFSVGENKSRTWIFTKLDNGKLQLKHQHLHDDGSVDEVSNYGGMSDGGDFEVNGDTKTIHIHFPADDFTKKLIPEASTNVWTIELISNASSNNAMSYNLYRNSKKRFIAGLNQVK